MKWVTSAMAAMIVMAAVGSAQAQDDYEQVKKRILQKLEAEIQEFYKRLEKELRATIRDELAKMKNGESKKETARKEEPKEAKKEEPKAKERKKGYLGIIRDRDFDDDARGTLGLGPGVGLRVLEVREGTPAEGKLAAGMVILSINGDKVNEESMREIMGKYFAGDTLTMAVLTADKEKKEVKVTLGER